VLVTQRAVCLFIKPQNNSEYSLHSFRSLGDKKTLLDAASASMNGNAMMTVILFLKVRTS
jgi:hypothetical protein